MAQTKKLVLLCFFVLMLLSCDRSNPLAPQNQQPSGLSFSEEKLDLGSEEYNYRQIITVNTEKDENTLFAYHLTFMNPSEEPELLSNEEGWLLFDDEIWTSQSQLSAEFQSVEGRLQNIITAVKVKVKSPDGSIQILASAFKSTRLIGTLIDAPFENGSSIGLGAEFLLREQIGDIYVDGMYVDHFMYRVNILDEDLQPIQTGDWYSSIDLPDLRKVSLNAGTTPALVVNEPDTYTQFQCYVVSRSGVEQDQPSSVYFKSLYGFKPRAILYEDALVGYGQHHYGMFKRDIPPAFYDQICTDGDKLLRKLWVVSGNLEAIHSDDFKLHIRWGYLGQYGYYDVTNEFHVTENPFYSELNWVLNDASSENYGSHITAFWLRLDWNPFPVMEQFFNPTVETDSSGQQWLRVPNFNDASRHCILQNLSSGNHMVELMVEDSQGVKSDPISRNISLKPMTEPAQRDGILIVDNTPFSYIDAPEAIIDMFYDDVLPLDWGMITEYAMDENQFSTVSPSVLMNYRAVMIHQDNTLTYHDSSDLREYADALDIYLDHQGSVLISGTFDLASDISDLSNCSPMAFDFVRNRMGIIDPEALGVLGSSVYQNPFFINAIGQGGISDIPLNLTNPFSSFVELTQGLPQVTYFDPSLNLDWLYGFGCKAVDSAIYPPTQEQYDLYSSKYVGYTHSFEGGNIAVFGFPLSYMEQDAVANAMGDIISEMLGEKISQRRN